MMDTMTSHRVSLSVCVSLCLCVGLVWSNPLHRDFTDGQKNELLQQIGQIIGQCGIPVYGLGVVRGDATYVHGEGLADYDTGHTATQHTMFSLGAGTKAFLPYILADILQEQQRWSWDSTLADIFHGDPDLQVSSQLTLRDLLTHQSGASAADLSVAAGLPGGVDKEELLRRLDHLPTSDSFRRSGHHSNYMYTLAALAAERISGKSWTELMESRVLSPLAMNETTFTPGGLVLQDAAKPIRITKMQDYKTQNTSLFDLSPSEAIGSVMSSPRDMTRWLRQVLGQLKGGNPAHSEVFAAREKLPQGQSEGLLTPPSEVPLGYGMGWSKSSYNGMHRYSFSGSLYAFRSYFWILPKEDVAVFLSVVGPDSEKNTRRAMEGILYTATDIALGKTPEVKVEEVCEDELTDDPYYYYEEAPIESTQILYEKDVQLYEGRYGNKIVGDLVIEADVAGVLHLRLGQRLRGELFPENGNNLRLNVTGELANTEDWSMEKIVEFRSSAESGVDFDMVLLHVSDRLSYEFRRDVSFWSNGREATPRVVFVPKSEPSVEPSVVSDTTTSKASTVQKSSTTGTVQTISTTGPESKDSIDHHGNSVNDMTNKSRDNTPKNEESIPVTRPADTESSRASRGFKDNNTDESNGETDDGSNENGTGSTEQKEEDARTGEQNIKIGAQPGYQIDLSKQTSREEGQEEVDAQSEGTQPGNTAASIATQWRCALLIPSLFLLLSSL